jgi:hypothetical protein
MSKITFFAFLLFTVQFAYAQGIGKISGQVVDEQKRAINGATVILTKNSNNALIKVTLTDTEGKFEFENLKFDSCQLSVSFVGMSKYVSPLLVLNDQKTTVELPLIGLSSVANALEEVKVTAKKAFVVQKIDRTVINPDALIGNAGTTALEVLEKSPGITVDINGIIALKGRQGVVIFIDDKPTYLSAADLASYLRTVPSASIESIEIMINPPAKYDAAGNAGVINIKLKKNIAKGFNGGINLSYGQGRFLRSNNSFNFNYRINQFNFFSNFGITQNNSYQDLTIERKYFTPTGQLSSTFTQNSYIKPEAGGKNIKAGFDFYATKKTTFGLVLSGFRNLTNRNVANNATIGNPKNEVVGLVEAINPLENILKNGSINLNFSHKFDKKGREISANLDDINYRSTISQTLTNSALAPDRTFINKSILASSLPSSIYIKTAKIDFANPLADGGTFEAGLKTSFVKTDNVADFFDVVDQTRTPNYEFSNNFKYSENINAAYVNYARNFKKLSIQTGLRFENTNIKGNQLGNVVVKDSSFTRKYSNLFPTFYLSYQFDTTSTHQVNLSVGRRIDRPNYKDMNPFSYPLDRFTYYGGNPFLRPTFSYNIALSYIYKNFLTTSLEFSQVNNVISETNEQRGNIYYSRPGNFAKQIAYGVSVNGVFKPYKWWTIQLYTSLLNNTYQSPVYTEILNASRWYWVLAPVNQFQINKSWSAELAGNYQTRVLSGQFLVIPIGSIRAGIATKILKEKGTLKLNVSDVFYTNQVGGDIRNIANASASWYSYLDTRVVTVSFSYRFSKGENLKVRQSGASDTEQKRVKS